MDVSVFELWSGGRGRSALGGCHGRSSEGCGKSGRALGREWVGGVYRASG